jgi:hypothetical protein
LHGINREQTPGHPPPRRVSPTSVRTPASKSSAYNRRGPRTSPAASSEKPKPRCTNGSRTRSRRLQFHPAVAPPGAPLRRGDGSGSGAEQTRCEGLADLTNKHREIEGTLMEKGDLRLLSHLFCSCFCLAWQEELSNGGG